jgi:hypothetical protein
LPCVPPGFRRLGHAEIEPAQAQPVAAQDADIAAASGGEAPADGGAGIEVNRFPHAHGDHFHLGTASVSSRDATGLANEAVWVALERKGLIRSGFPYSATLTPAGLAYQTGLADQILHRADH